MSFRKKRPHVSDQHFREGDDFRRPLRKRYPAEECYSFESGNSEDRVISVGEYRHAWTDHPINSRAARRVIHLSTVILQREDPLL